MLSGVSPCGTCHRSSPRSRLIAASVPYGGFTIGSPWTLRPAPGPPSACAAGGGGGAVCCGRGGASAAATTDGARSGEHTSELQARQYLVCPLLLEKKKK